jgi:hypothetical protein
MAKKMDNSKLDIFMRQFKEYIEIDCTYVFTFTDHNAMEGIEYENKQEERNKLLHVKFGHTSRIMNRFKNHYKNFSNIIVKKIFRHKKGSEKLNHENNIRKLAKIHGYLLEKYSDCKGKNRKEICLMTIDQLNIFLNELC